MENYQKEY